MGAQDVLDTVQALYETHKAVTYPRTDCRYLPTSMLGEADTVLDAIARSDPEFASAVDSADRSRQSKAWNDTKITAHHAIIPTGKPCDRARMSAAERRLYEMIRTRYAIQFYSDHEVDKTVLAIDISGAAFRATGKAVIVDGWQALERAGGADEGGKAGDNACLPAVSQGDACTVASTEIQAKQTRPPAHYTEGTLIAAMKNVASLVSDPRLKKVMKDTAGLGTEATRAGIITTLIDRGFLARKNKKLIATETGHALIAVLPAAISNPDTTALWEQALDDISSGRMGLDEFVRHQTRWVNAALDQVRSNGLNLSGLPASKPAQSCPDCGQPMRKRKSRHGAFWGCTGYPDCKATVRIAGKRRRNNDTAQ